MYVQEYIIGLSSIFNLYQFLTFMGIWNLPYISSIAKDSMILTMAKVCVVKWAPVFGILGLLLVIADIFFVKDKCIDYTKTRTSLSIFYIVIAIICLF